MKIRICIIGVLDSIELVKQVSGEFENFVKFTYFAYNSVDEILEFIDKKSDIDVIMFTGHYPYVYFKNNALLNIPFFAVSKSNETLKETFWNIRNEGIDYKKVSIDRSPKSEIFEILKDLKIPEKEIYLIGDSSEMPLEKIYEFHKSNYDSGRVEAIISSNYKIYKKLKKEGYKVYRTLPSRFLLRESIKKAISIAGTERIKSNQVVVQTIRLKDVSEEASTKYKQLKTVNKFDDILIDYTQELQGSYFKFGSNDYMIFTTRRFIGLSDIQKNMGMLIEKSDKLGVTFALGIGYGDSIQSSEKNSKIALKYANDLETSGCYIVDDDSSITGPIFVENSNNFRYSLINTDKNLERISNKTGVSEKYLLKLKAIINKRADDRFQTEELSEFLNLSQRSALRILDKLETGGFAEVIGSSSKNTRGRPRKIFKINLNID